MNSSPQRFSRDALNVQSGLPFTAGNDRFELAGAIGTGAIGVVRKAVNVKTNTLVAIKFLAPEMKYIEASSFEDIHSRFRREGERGPSLDHDHLVSIYDYEENENGRCFEGNSPTNPFLIMEYVPGRTLEHHIMKQDPKGVLNITPRTLHTAYAIVSALLYLHERSITHRDVKPANIFVSKEAQPGLLSVVKLGDFGVVKWGDFKASLTTGTLTVAGAQGLGTLKYMSPEQAMEPRGVTVRSDMYSLGITLFELFTNRILATPHHVFNLARLRYKRGTTMSKIYELSLGILPTEYEELFSQILDCLLDAPKSRPSSLQMAKTLRALLRTEGVKID